MKTILIITWLLLGVIALWRAYWGTVKDWYEVCHEDIRKSDNHQLRVLLSFSVIILLNGLIALILLEIIFKNTWYYKIPK